MRQSCYSDPLLVRSVRPGQHQSVPCGSSTGTRGRPLPFSALTVQPAASTAPGVLRPASLLTLPSAGGALTLNSVVCILPGPLPFSHGSLQPLCLVWVRFNFTFSNERPWSEIEVDRQLPPHNDLSAASPFTLPWAYHSPSHRPVLPQPWEPGRPLSNSCQHVPMAFLCKLFLL